MCGVLTVIRVQQQCIRLAHVLFQCIAETSLYRYFELKIFRFTLK